MERRICSEVIVEMIKHIPKDKKELLEDLEWNYEDASYKAPEEFTQWYNTMTTLQKHFPDPKENWEFEVLSIFTTLSIEDLKRKKLLEKV